MPIDDNQLRLANVREKFGQALNELATEPGRPQEWLRAAWLRFHTVRPDDLPPGELRKLFIGIRSDLTSEEPTGNEGSVAATLRKMNNKQAVQLVDRIMAFYRKIRAAP